MKKTSSGQNALFLPLGDAPPLDPEQQTFHAAAPPAERAEHTVSPATPTPIKSSGERGEGVRGKELSQLCPPSLCSGWAGPFFKESSPLSPALLPPLPHIGIDEAGRGCLAGPVVAAAVLLPDDASVAALLPGLDDSKKLTEKERDRLAALIVRHAWAFGYGLAWQEEIDAANILNATFRAMSRAVFSLGAQPGSPGLSATGELLPFCIDGNHCIPQGEWQAACTAPPSAAVWEREAGLTGEERLWGVSCHVSPHVPPLPAQRAVIGGDGLVPSIAAASILAKTLRDEVMRRLDPRFPAYGFARHKGYGSKDHIGAIRVHGPCPLHRMTFRKVRPEETQLPLL